MSNLTDMFVESKEVIYRGVVSSILDNMYKIQIGSKEVYAELSVDEKLFIGQSVILAKTQDNYFIVGVGTSSVKPPTVIEIDG